MTPEQTERPGLLPQASVPPAGTPPAGADASVTGAAPASAIPESATEPEAPPERLAGKIQSLKAAVWLLAAFGGIALLYWARSFFIPLCCGIVLAYTLRPAADRMVKIGLPRALSALLICTSLAAVSVYAVYALRDDAAELLEQLPEAVKKVRMSVQNAHDKPRTLVRVREAARELDRAAAEVAGQPSVAARQAAPVVGFADKVQGYALQQGVSLVGLIAQLFFTLLLAYYLLSEGDAFKRSMLKLVGPSLQRKKITVRILDDINSQIQRYMVSMLVVNTLMGVVVGLCFHLLGMNYALLWGIAAGVLHFIPYVGQAVLLTGSGLAAYLQFGSAGQAALVVGVGVLTSFFIGLMFMNWLQSRLARISPTLLFVAVMFFGWLWGGWGFLLAYPVVAIVKSVCDHVEGLQPFGEFMSRGLAGRREAP